MSDRTNLLCNTAWSARPEYDDYLNTISFAEEVGFAIYGDGQAIRWASYFRYVFEKGWLQLEFLPTEDHVGTWNQSEYTVQTEIQIGHVTYEASSRGKVAAFAGNALTFAKPFHRCDDVSLVFFESAFDGVAEEDTRMRVVTR